MSTYMLTTIDNPFDPGTQFDEWNTYDMRSGYHTLAFLARLVQSSNELSEADQQLAIQLAVDEIAKENVLGIYRKVEVETPLELDDSALQMID